MARHVGWEHHSGNVGLDSPRYHTAGYIYSLNPNTKLIVILRNPVER